MFVCRLLAASQLIVEELAEVVSARVGTEDDDEMVAGQTAGVAQGGGGGGAAGAADQQPFATGQGLGGVERFGIADANPFIDQLAVERFGHEILADAFDLPRTRRVAGQDRAFRIGADDLDFGILLLEIAGHAGDGAAGADAGDEDGDPPFGLLPDFVAGGAIMDFRDWPDW